MLLKLAALILTLALPFTAYAGEGGGSSTGGGHVRVCLKPQAALKAKAIIEQGQLIPQISGNPFEGVKADDILSVDLLDLIEHPEVKAVAKSLLAESAAKVHREKPQEGNDKTDVLVPSVHMIRSGSETLREALQKTKAPEWSSDSSPIGQYMLNIISSYFPWTPSKSGLRFTSDFSPRIKIEDNCVFAQAVRQSVFSRNYATLDFDQLLLSKMSDDDLLVLGLHEQLYNVVMLGPKYDRVVSPSVLTRKLTTLALGILSGHQKELEPQFFEILSRLGYTPFENLVPSTTKGAKK